MHLRRIFLRISTKITGHVFYTIKNTTMKFHRDTIKTLSLTNILDIHYTMNIMKIHGANTVTCSFCILINQFVLTILCGINEKLILRTTIWYLFDNSILHVDQVTRISV